MTDRQTCAIMAAIIDAGMLATNNGDHTAAMTKAAEIIGLLPANPQEHSPTPGERRQIATRLLELMIRSPLSWAEEWRDVSAVSLDEQLAARAVRLTDKLLLILAKNPAEAPDGTK